MSAYVSSGVGQPATLISNTTLYNLDRVHKVLAALKYKPIWELEDTSSFDTVHYISDATIENAARALDLQAGDHVVEIGSAFGSRGRYLADRYRARVTGVDSQKEIHDVASLVNRRSETRDRVASVNANVLELDATKDLYRPADHVISFFCIFHIEDRPSLFDKAFEMLKPAGKMYIEDFYMREPFAAEDIELLLDVMPCPPLPSREEYIGHLEGAEFRDVMFEDLTPSYIEGVQERAKLYHSQPDRRESLDRFYDGMLQIFSTGRIGHARVCCRRP